MYACYQNMLAAYVVKHDIKDVYNDVMLVSFFESIKIGYAVNTLSVIYSCINASFIDRFGLNLKGLPGLKKYLKQKTNKYVAKKSLTFDAKEIHEVLPTLQDRKDNPYTILYGVCIALLYFDLLRVDEVRAVEMVDVDLNHGMKEITVKFTHKQKQRNDGFRYNIPPTFFSMFKRYMGQICMNTVRSGKVQFLKNRNDNGKRHIQNTGKYTVNKLHKVACEIRKRPPPGYTSHTWRRSAATNLTNTGLSF